MERLFIQIMTGFVLQGHIYAWNKLPANCLKAVWSVTKGDLKGKDSHIKFI